MELSFQDAFFKILQNSGLPYLTSGHGVMIAVALSLIYLAIRKKFEPLLLLPIGFSSLLANLPLADLAYNDADGLFQFFYTGIKYEVLPPLIFLGIGAMTDFGPLLANPSTLLIGAAAQLGIFITMIGATLLGFDLREAGAIGVIGGADGPTSIFLAMKLAPHLLAPIAVAAYTYIALTPLIQPPIMRLLTTPQERKIRMRQLQPVSQTARILFPLACAVTCGLLLPGIAPLLGMMMLGNLLRECGVTARLSNTAETHLINTVTLTLSIAVGSTMTAENFLQSSTLKIILLGLVAFAGSTAAGLIMGKIMCKVTGGKINPLIGSAGVSAVPMAARVSQKLGAEADHGNYLLMHAMGPNVAGIIGTAIVAGIFLALLPESAPASAEILSQLPW